MSFLSNQTRRERAVAVVIIGLIAMLLGAFAQEQEQKQSPLLSAVLGGDSAAWTVTAQNGSPIEYTIKEIDSRPTLLTEGNNVAVTGKTQYSPNTEILLRFRLTPPRGQGASLTVKAAIPSSDDIKQAPLEFGVSVGGGSDEMSWHATDPAPKDPKKTSVNGTYNLKGIKGRSLNWPEDLRKSIEHDMASLLAVEQKWLTVRYVLRKEAFRIYLDDRLVIDRAKPGLNVSGMVRVDLSPHVQLALVQVRPFDEANPVFETISIHGHLNASRIDGKTVQRDSLPQAGKTHVVKGVPFVFPEADQQGNNHIDVGRSWLQTGYLEDPNWPQTGGVGGRWSDAFQLNPTRIKFSLPKGRYRALHLMVALDHEPDSVPVVSVQFYRPAAGHPVSFSTRVPVLTAKASDVTALLPVKLDDGSPANLYLVTIPIDPGAMAAFDDKDPLEMELTKEVKLFRAYPDPMFYSEHGAGLPSSVHVYAMTLERPATELVLKASEYCNIWTAPVDPVYTATLRNRMSEPRNVKLKLVTESYYGANKMRQEAKVSVPAGQEVTKTFTLKPKLYGYHTVDLTMTDGDQVWVEHRTLAYLHADTREKGDWEIGRGPVWGFWNWGGGLDTPSSALETYIMALAGAESCLGSFEHVEEEEKEIARKFKMFSLKQFGAGDHWITSALMWDVKKGMTKEEALAKMISDLKKTETKPSPITRTIMISFFAEPAIGDITHGSLPSYWGEPEYELTEQEEEAYKVHEWAFIAGAREVKKLWPDVKCMLPHGDPLFCVPFLRRSKEVRELFGGVTIDIPCFERLPEQQVQQISLHRLYMLREELRKAGISDPFLPMFEGPCLPSNVGALSETEQADLDVRNSLILLGYGVNPQVGGWPPFDCASYWGEQHYGGGICHRIPLEIPKPAYAAFATMTRHLNRKPMNKWIPTGSLSVYAMQFKHYRTGELLHVFWTIRGKRPVTLDVPQGTQVMLFDDMDNETPIAEKDGKITFIIDQTPFYVEGLKEDAKITLGGPDHSDARPAEIAARLDNLGSGAWGMSTEEDLTYANNHFIQIRRYPGEMTIGTVEAPKEQGGKALSVHLGKQKKERKIMPFYTSLVPKQPVTIPGKASHLGLWVKGASDWGRVVYCLLDNAGERWISVGTKEQWNCDDLHSWSYFNFDGWRYVRFELPANSPYDMYRENGSSWWGHFGKGDGVVDLPLKIEKIIVERRTHVMYVNDPQPARPDDVLLADLYAEYERQEDNTDEAVRLSRLRMPVPPGIPELGNPIEEMTVNGVGEPTVVTNITLPSHQYDGTRCHVHFEPIEGATSYDVWVSPYENGHGALKLGEKWKEPGNMIYELRPDTDFYVFVTYVDKDGKLSKPSKSLKIRLKDIFAMK